MDSHMECPYCSHKIAPAGAFYYLGEHEGIKMAARSFQCQACGGLIVSKIDSLGFNILSVPAEQSNRYSSPGDKVVPLNGNYHTEEIIYPKTQSEKKYDGVGPEITKDFNEARWVLEYSPNASAALSRRCLQTILRKKEGIRKPDLFGEIEEAITRKIYDKSISKWLDQIRKIGNAGAHPISSKVTSEIIEVTKDHASTLILVLEKILKHYEEDTKIETSTVNFHSQ